MFLGSYLLSLGTAWNLEAVAQEAGILIEKSPLRYAYFMKP